MLTKNERKWLHQRRHWNCIYCPPIPRTMCLMGERPAYCAIADTDWKDAAEFEGRVAEKLAWLADLLAETNQYRPNCSDVCPAVDICPKGYVPDCRRYLLKYARLKVEEEMN